MRSKTKGRFPVDFQTTAGAWMKDRDWKQRANPVLQQRENKIENSEVKMLEKRKKQKILQNIALEAQYKIVVKKPRF